jgi:hypothetical protein
VHAPERVRGMVVELPVLDNALLGCAIAFTPLTIAPELRRGRSCASVARCGARGWPTGAAPLLADQPGHHPTGPRAQRGGPARALLRPHGAAQRLSIARLKRRRWSSATSATGAPLQRLDALVAELPNAAWSGQLDPRAAHQPEPSDRRDRRLPRHLLGGARRGGASRARVA